MTRPYRLAVMVGLVLCLPRTGRSDPAIGQSIGQSIDLAGDWRYQPYDGEGDLCDAKLDDSAWPTMRLPSNWFLLGNKEYPKKALAENHRIGAILPGELSAVDPARGFDYEGTVWFRRHVEVKGKGAVAADHVREIIDLDMVDYYAQVFVNGRLVGKHEGYFQHFSVDVTAALVPGDNQVCVRVSAPALVFDLAQQFQVSWPKQQNQIKGIFAYHDTRPGATSYRGQERGTGGILRGVALRTSSGIDLSEMMVTPLDVSAASARLIVTAKVHNWTGAPIEARLDGDIGPRNFSSNIRVPVEAPIKAPPGESRIRIEVKLDKPALWWSWDYGRPNLYRLHAVLRSGEAVLDEKTVSFGVRSINHDANWVWRLNGQRIYPRGSNYISSQWLSQTDRASAERDVRLMIGANLNSMRIHAHLERPEFYDVADEMGLMVFQDFPLQWGYTDMPSFHGEAMRQARDMIEQFHDHPSIIVWCMHNESPHAMDWMKRKEKDQNLALDNSLAAAATLLDPSRVIQRDSGTGDGHYYWGWYVPNVAAINPLPPSVAPFITEYGAQALPVKETLLSMFAPEERWPPGNVSASDKRGEWEAWRFADFQPEMTFDIAGVGTGKDLDAFIANSQLYQANLIRYQTEVFRRLKWTRTTGIYHFMFADDWPSITWSVVDYYRREKPGYAALRSSMQRLLPSIEYRIEDPTRPIAIHVVNDYLTPFAGARLFWRLVDKSGKATMSGQKKIEIAADSASKAVDLGSLPQIHRDGLRLETWVEDRRGSKIGESSLGAENFIVPVTPAR